MRTFRTNATARTYLLSVPIRLGNAVNAQVEASAKGLPVSNVLTQVEYQASALASPQPLWALWEFSTDPAGVALTMEFIALSRHRPTLRAQIAEYSEQFRRQQADAIAAVLDRYGIQHEDLPPVVASVLMTCLSRVIIMEDSLGVTGGHAETVSRVEHWFHALEGPRPARPG